MLEASESESEYTLEFDLALVGAEAVLVLACTFLAFSFLLGSAVRKEHYENGKKCQNG